jgi:beta-glucosidase
MGKAVADVIFGNYNPSGRLPVTFYAKDTDLPDFEDYSMHNRTYRYFKGTALYPFGYGLSFSVFSYAWKANPAKIYQDHETISGSFSVTNTSTLPGDEVAQVYIKYPQGNGFPQKEIRFFARIHIAPGKKSEVEFSIPASDLKKWDEKSGTLVVPKGMYSLFIGRNSGDESLLTNFEIR